MSVSCGFVGLPNVGKSTLFNCVLKKAAAQAANYPFCTIEPNVGSVPVPDARLSVLSNISKSSKLVPSLLKCVDIAGLVRGAHSGEGLGNQFLGHIRQVDLIVHVLRCFRDGDVTHVDGDVDPLRDYDTISMELQFVDIGKLEEFLNKRIIDAKDKAIAQKALDWLKNNFFLNTTDWDEASIEFFNEHGMLTHKPMLVVANVDDNQDADLLAKIAHLNPIKISAALEEMLIEIEDSEERLELLKESGFEEDGLSKLLKQSFDKLELINFFTTGKQETRAWKVKKGSNMQQAAGKIHTDFEKGFISAAVVGYDNFVSSNGWVEAKESGSVRTASKVTLVEDGDIVIFKSYLSK